MKKYSNPKNWVRVLFSSEWVEYKRNSCSFLLIEGAYAKRKEILRN